MSLAFIIQVDSSPVNSGFRPLLNGRQAIYEIACNTSHAVEARRGMIRS
jgi:hypothetical protein